MAEAGEGNPATNFQKTLGVQNERVESLNVPLGFMDKLVGQYTTGEVDAKYRKEQGGSISTDITSGRAKLYQKWDFDKNGNLVGVEIKKELRPDILHDLEANKDAGVVRLVREKDGKFHVQEITSNADSPKWAKEFHTAKIRMAGNKPTVTSSPQKSK